MLEITTDSPAATRLFGQQLAQRLESGDTICLCGELGVGKTLLVQGIAGGLGVTETVTSPTFALLQIYETGRLTLCHFDLYRLEHESELTDIGFEEYSRPDGVAIIEWADKFAARMPDECLWVEIRSGVEADERVIAFSARGARYDKLCEELKNIAVTCLGHRHTGVQRGSGHP